MASHRNAGGVSLLLLLCSISAASSLYSSRIMGSKEKSSLNIDVSQWMNHEVSVSMVGGRKSRMPKQYDDSFPKLTLTNSAEDYSSCNLTVTTPGAPAHGGILAEPHKESSFVLQLDCQSGVNPSTLSVVSYGPRGQVAYGYHFSMVFTNLGASNLKVCICVTQSVAKGGDFAECTAENSVKAFTTSVAVTYVRREVRSLSEDERKRYFNAIKTLKRYSTEEGQAIYGEKFHSYGEFVAKHMAVSWGNFGMCNMGHNGPGFLPFHRAFVRQFEQAIQSIEPTVSSPYWDYMADSELSDYSTSEIWSEEFYGDMVGDENDRYQVKNGQFANWSVPYGREAQYLANLTWGTLGPVGIVNPYGYLRSPNVNNAAPYTTRMGNVLDESLSTHDNFVTCNDYTTLGEIIICLERYAHVTAHDVIGGLTGLPEFADVKDELNCTQFSSEDNCKTTFDSYKEYGLLVRALSVRDGCITCDRLCDSIDDDPSLCSCQCIHPAPLRCSAYFTMQRFFSETDIVDGAEFAGYGLCTPEAFVGDYADVAASVNDPIFWPHHTNADRVFSSWRRLNPTGDWEEMNFTYPSTDNSKYPDKFSDLNIIDPDVPWPGVLPPGDGNPTGVCEGHGLWDPTLRASFVGLFRSLYGTHNPHTNLELLTTLDVEINSPHEADYIYDKYISLT